jgi:hypothetical protein
MSYLIWKTYMTRKSVLRSAVSVDIMSRVKAEICAQRYDTIYRRDEERGLMGMRMTCERYRNKECLEEQLLRKVKSTKRLNDQIR